MVYYVICKCAYNSSVCAYILYIDNIKYCKVDGLEVTRSQKNNNGLNKGANVIFYNVAHNMYESVTQFQLYGLPSQRISISA